MNKPTILITGGAGFLGSHLSDAYLDKGYKVICVDNLSTGSTENIKHIFSEDDFEYFEHDICNPLPESILTQNIDVIANLACPASPPQYQRLALETLAVGSVGLVNLLELAKVKNARFFQASTSEVYGDPDIHPQPESYKGNVNCYGPRSMYDESKRFSEATIYVYKNVHDVDTVIGRFFNTYGPRMDAADGRVVSNFIMQALENDDITVYGDGSQTRSFCYVDDLIRAIVSLIESKEQGPMNLGNPGEFTVFELAEIIKSLTKSDSNIIYKPLPGDDPLQRKPDITIATQRLGWKPEIPLRAGLEKTINYFMRPESSKSHLASMTTTV